MSGWMIFHEVTSLAAVALTAAFTIADKKRACLDNLIFAIVLMVDGIVSDAATVVTSLGPLSDLMDAFTGAGVAALWLYRQRPLWDWRVGLALIELFTMGFHSAYQAGIYHGEAALIGYQWRLGILALLARGAVVAGPTKTVVQWASDRWFPVPDRRDRARPASTPARRATWP